MHIGMPKYGTGDFPDIRLSPRSVLGRGLLLVIFSHPVFPHRYVSTVGAVLAAFLRPVEEGVEPCYGGYPEDDRKPERYLGHGVHFRMPPEALGATERNDWVHSCVWTPL